MLQLAPDWHETDNEQYCIVYAVFAVCYLHFFLQMEPNFNGIKLVVM